MKLKWDEEQKQFVNAETGEVFTMPDGEPLEIEGMKTQADIQAAINSKTKKHQEELGTLKKALEEAQSNSQSSAEQIQSLKNMVATKEKEVDAVRKEAEEESRAELVRLRSDLDKSTRARDEATKALNRELINNSILGQANVPGREFIRPNQVVALMGSCARVVEKKNEKGETLLQDGLPVREVLFEMEIDELDPVTSKPTGKKNRDFLPADRAVEQFLKENPNLVRGSNTGGSGNTNVNQTVDGKKLLTKEQMEGMTPEQINANWDLVQQSVASL